MCEAARPAAAEYQCDVWPLVLRVRCKLWRVRTVEFGDRTSTATEQCCQQRHQCDQNPIQPVAGKGAMW